MRDQNQYQDEKKVQTQKRKGMYLVPLIGLVKYENFRSLDFLMKYRTIKGKKCSSFDPRSQYLF